ncbi:hypothetical protein QIG62_27755, partial [Klebsiella pneumoniae]|nr:hypothetical protein [Klebsiella pneumoniae]
GHAKTSAAKEKPVAKHAKSRAAVKRVTKLPDFVEPQLCASVENPPSGSNWVHEIKFDGYRVQMRIENGDVTLS